MITYVPFIYVGMLIKGESGNEELIDGLPTLDPRGEMPKLGGATLKFPLKPTLPLGSTICQNGAT